MKKLNELLLPLAVVLASAHSDSRSWICNRDEIFELEFEVPLHLAYWATGQNSSFTLSCHGFEIRPKGESRYRQEMRFSLSDANEWNIITFKLSWGFRMWTTDNTLSMDPFDALEFKNIEGKERIRLRSERTIYWQKCSSGQSCVPEPQKCPSPEPFPQSQKCPTVPADITTLSTLDSPSELVKNATCYFSDLTTLVLLIMCCLLILIIIGLVVYIIRGKKAMPEAPEANMRQGTNMRQVDNVTLNSLYGNLDFLNAEMAVNASSTQPRPPASPPAPETIYEEVENPRNRGIAVAPRTTAMST